MTRYEKIDYIREIEPLYRENSILFSYTEKKLDELIVELKHQKKIDNIKASAEKVINENKQLKQEIIRLKNEKNTLNVNTSDDRVVSLTKENNTLKQQLKKANNENAELWYLLKQIKELLKGQKC